MSLSKEINYSDLEKCKGLVRSVDSQVGSFNMYVTDLYDVGARINSDFMNYVTEGMVPVTHWSHPRCVYQRVGDISPGVPVAVARTKM